MDSDALREWVEERTGRPAPRDVSVLTDTTEFMNIYRGHVLLLGGRHFFVEGDTREGRFGVDDQPKFWVKRAVELESGDSKVLKLVFIEDFHIRIGLLRMRCYRDPAKEAEVLRLVRGDDRFMQGETLADSKGNPVRVIDYIRGPNLWRHLSRIDLGHEEYFFTVLPDLLRRLLPALEGIAMIHAAGQLHGDIRNDHLIIDAASGKIRWIDFDLCQDISDFDVWSLGNVLLYVIGKGEHTFHDLAAGRIAPHLGAKPLTEHDASAFFVHRIMNLGKLFPYIPDDLTDVLMHFSFGTSRFYETVVQILMDLRPIVETMGGNGGAENCP